MKYLLIFLGLLGGFSACEKPEVNNDNLALGAENEIKASSELVYADGIHIELTKVEDSRCPKNVVCVWMGKTVVYLTVSKGNFKEDLVIEVMADLSKPVPARFTIDGKLYEIFVTEVLPYPEDTNDLDLKDYKIKITCDLFK